MQEPPLKLYDPTNQADLSLASTQTFIAPQVLQDLLSATSAAKARAYCPYSNFRVGAAILLATGQKHSPSGNETSLKPQIITGANVENAAYPVGTCAERVAIGKAVTDESVVGEGGFIMGMFAALAVASDISPPASPCGMCRQFIREFCELSMPVFMVDKDGRFHILSLEQLLPLSFGPEALPGSGLGRV